MSTAAQYKLHLAWLFVLSVMIGTIVFTTVWFGSLHIVSYLVCNSDFFAFTCSSYLERRATEPLLELVGQTAASWVVLFIFSIPQQLLFALPITLTLAKALEVDAKRNWVVFAFGGALLGGGPWVIGNYFLYESRSSVFANFGYSLLTTGIGICSGLAFKSLLVRSLRSNERIENIIN